VLVPGNKFPDDLDTTSLALMVVPPESQETATAVLNKMLEYVLPDGRFQVSLDAKFCETSFSSSASTDHVL
jgi:hypothetical protein